MSHEQRPAGCAERIQRARLPAASTDDIAERCGVNKRMIYYYFGSKEGLYLAALESCMKISSRSKGDRDRTSRSTSRNRGHHQSENRLLRRQPPLHFVSIHGEFLQGPASAKVKKARHVQVAVDRRYCAHSRAWPTQRTIQTRYRAGELLRFDLGLCIMYFTNQYTLGVIFGRKMTRDDNIQRHKRTVVDIVLSYLRRRMPYGLQPPRRRLERYASLVS